jgi:hypothetical protein
MAAIKRDPWTHSLVDDMRANGGRITQGWPAGH